jgi:hypothetical protein
MLTSTNRLAKKTARGKVTKWSEKCWLEMGVFTLTIFGYVMNDGKYAVDV